MFIPGDVTYTHDILVRTDVQLPTALVGVLLALMGAMGNGAVLYILICGPKSSMTSSKLLVIVLAVVDFITCAFLIPLQLADMLTGFHPGSPYFVKEYYCKARAFFSIYIACVKYHIILLISMERYILVRHPFRAKTLLELSKVSIAIIVIMVVALVMSLPFPINFITDVAFRINGTDVAICAWNYKRAGIILVSWQVYCVIVFILYYFIPLIITTCAYSFIFNALYKGRRPSLPGEPSAEDAELRITLAKLMLSIAILFAVLNSPLFLVGLLITFGVSPPDNMLLFIVILTYLSTLNSIINPFLYCSHTKSFFKTKIVALFRFESYDFDKTKESHQTYSTHLWNTGTFPDWWNYLKLRADVFLG